MLQQTKKGNRWNKVIVLTFCLCVVYITSCIPFFAEYVYARGITRFINAILNAITNPFAVSFYEAVAFLLIIAGVIVIVALIDYIIKKQFLKAGTLLYRLLIVVLSVLVAFCALYSPLYHRDSVYDSLGLDMQTASSATEKDLVEAAEYFIAELNETGKTLSRDDEGNIIAPIAFEEASQILNDCFPADGYFASYTVNSKKVQASVVMSYLGISGIYFPFTAESNVNMQTPSYAIPTVMAHEMAHAKGVSLENEANVVSYTLCVRSDNDYIRYSGLMAATARLLNSVSSDTKKLLRSKIDEEILKEYANASTHYAQYEGWIDNVSTFFNNLFLQANGVSEGTKSYSNTTLSLYALYLSLV